MVQNKTKMKNNKIAGIDIVTDDTELRLFCGGNYEKARKKINMMEYKLKNGRYLLT